jgi:hypothetical protein
MIGTSGWFSSTQTLSTPEAAERRQKVLDGFRRRRCWKRGSLKLLAAAQVRDMSRDFDPAKVGPLEADAVVGRGWA